MPVRRCENICGSSVFAIEIRPAVWYYYPCKSRRYGEIGRRKGLKIPRSNIRTGSSPVTGRKAPLLR